MLLGQFTASLFFKVSSIGIAISCIAIYYISQYYKHDKPFPHSWISDCAAHFPEFIVFRISTIAGSVLLLLGWMVNHFYLRSISIGKFNLAKYYPQVSLIMGIMSSFGLMFSTANLDTGIRNSDWHHYGATTFFLFCILAYWYNNVLCWIVYYKIKTISLMNLIGKTIISFLIIFQIYLSLTIKNDSIDLFQIGSDFGVLIEWTMTFTILAGLYLIGADAEKYQFVYVKNKNEQQTKISQSF